MWEKEPEQKIYPVLELKDLKKHLNRDFCVGGDQNPSRVIQYLKKNKFCLKKSGF